MKGNDFRDFFFEPRQPLVTIMIEQIEATQGANERLGGVIVIFFFVGDSVPVSEGFEEFRFRLIRFEVQ